MPQPDSIAVPDDANRFDAVEQLDEANKSIGWDIEYRQLHRGGFDAAFWHHEGEEIALTTEVYNNSLHVRAHPPDGMIGLVVPYSATRSASALSRPLANRDVILFPSQSEMDFLTVGETYDHALFLDQRRFKVMAETLFPGERIHTAGLSEVVSGDGEELKGIRDDMESCHGLEGGHDETLATLLTRTMSWISRMRGAAARDYRNPDNHRSGRVAKLAADYIEEHFRDIVRMEDLCRHTQVGVRTLQRCFAESFQVSPVQYLKARRLNAARRELVRNRNRDDCSVTDVAMGNGMYHLGRFSVEYRQLFGESPSTTLGR